MEGVAPPKLRIMALIIRVEKGGLPEERTLLQLLRSELNCAEKAKKQMNNAGKDGVFLVDSQSGPIVRCISLAEIRVQEGEPLENALRRFKRKVQTEDIIKEVKRHSFYLKPGEKKRVKEALARKRNRKKVRKEQD